MQFPRIFTNFATWSGNDPSTKNDTTMATLQTPNKHNALLMKRANTAYKLLGKIDEIGAEAVQNICLLLPFADKPEDSYMEFPDNGAITMEHPHNGNTLEVKRLFLDKRCNLCMEWYRMKKGEQPIKILDHYGAMDCVRLLDAIIIHYGKE